MLLQAALKQEYIYMYVSHFINHNLIWMLSMLSKQITITGKH